ncbi:MAG: hypothetical protein V4692_00930 [Bdellovibrionota bacterium]
MKQFIFSFLSISFFSLSAHSTEILTAKTPFWQTQYESQQSAKIAPVDLALASICADYERYVSSGAFGRDDIEFLRTETGSITNRQFSAKFKIVSVKPIQLGLMPTDTPKLPLYNQPLAALEPNYLPTGPVNIRTLTGKALIETSKSLGLRTLPIQIAGDTKSPVIRVTGKDAACDLLRGNAQLQFAAETTVRISFDAQTQISEFYDRLREVTKEAFERSSTLSGRAGFVGYRLATVLPTQDPELGVEWTGHIISTFYDGTMNRNTHWSESSGEKHLTVHGAVNAPIQITLEK